MAARTPIPAISLIKGKRNAPSLLHIRCHVKPGADRVREGVLAVSDNGVELCVAAAPRNGESNKAVVQVLSDRYVADLNGYSPQALKIPKMDLRIVQGLKSRDKTIELSSQSLQTTDEAKLEETISAIWKRLKDETD
ncbi:YggU-like protein [Apiospora sp. TS-2023a]